MGAISGTLVKGTEFGGEYKIVVISATIASASDQITVTTASHGINYVDAVICCVPTGGVDNDFQTCSATASGATITITSYQADGAAADEFTGTTVNVTVIGHNA